MKSAKNETIKCVIVEPNHPVSVWYEKRVIALSKSKVK